MMGGRYFSICVSATSEEDKRLILAAPDLLGVVMEAIPFLESIARSRHPSWMPEMADKDSILGRAYAAIAKTEGRS